jgi:hypothetical protein
MNSVWFCYQDVDDSPGEYVQLFPIRSQDAAATGSNAAVPFGYQIILA